MRYTDEEIKAADDALKFINKRRGEYVDSTELFGEMGKNNLMRNVMIEDLGLMSWHSTLLRLTDRGRLAAEKGFRKYIEELDREQIEVTIDRRVSILSGLYSLIGGGLVALLTWVLSRCES